MCYAVVMRALVVVALAFFVAACGSSSPDESDAAPDANTSDAASNDAASNDASTDATSGDTASYPAFAPDMPQILDQGGNVLSAPRVVTVTWQADPNAATFEAFGDAIGASNYWNRTTSEYAIAPAVSGASNHVRIQTAPATKMTDTALDTFVADQVSAAPGNGWPANDANTIYILYLPETLELTSDGSNACNVEEGYHDETFTSANDGVVYAVIVEGCHDTEDVVSFSTETASHELVESSTDPFIQEKLAWTGFDADHYAWETWTEKQDELADACQDNDDAYYTDVAPLPYALQRSWSNASAAAGHNPCVPVPQIPNYSAVALGTTSITLTVNTKTVTTKGFMIPNGQTQTIHVGLYSDAPTSDWTVSVVEGDGFSTPSTAHLTFTQSATTGNNGDTIDVGITTVATKSAGVLATILSTQNGINHYVPFLVATE
jgi:hypothetical protein